MPSNSQLPRRITTAMVMANGLATIYRRWGSGPTVLVLGASETFALALGDSFRVIVPELPLGFSELGAGRWLAGVCEGLGIGEVTILVAPALSEAALQFAREAPDRVKGVIIAGTGAPDEQRLRAAIKRSFS